MVREQVRQAKKAEVQAQKKSEKAAREAAEREKDLRSYKHVMQVRKALPMRCLVHPVLQTLMI